MNTGLWRVIFRSIVLLAIWGMWSLSVRMVPATNPQQRTLPEAAISPRLWLPVISHSYQYTYTVRLTNDPANDTQPAFSPDGRRVIFISDRTGQSDIYRMPIGGDVMVNLTDTADIAEETPVFSPDGTHIAFASTRAGDWNIYLMTADGADVQLLAGRAGSDEIQPAFMPDGETLVFASNAAGGNWDIYATMIGSDAWRRLTLASAADLFPTIPANGATIAFRSERDGNSEIYIMDVDGSHQRRLTTNPAFDGHPVITSDGSGVVFTSERSGIRGLYLVNIGGNGVGVLESYGGQEFDTPRMSPDVQILAYAQRVHSGTFDIYQRPFFSPLIAIGQRGLGLLGGHCDWEAGTLAYGWLHAWRATRDERFLMWARRWVDLCILLKESVSHVNDGLLGYAALVVYETDGGPERLAFVNEVVDYIMRTAPRAVDGTLYHESHTIWDDTLLATVPFLVEMGWFSRDSRYTENAIHQVLGHAARLQNKVTGLYHHAWDDGLNTYIGPSYWARGNGWALLADVEILATMPDNHPARASILDVLGRHVAGLLALQDAGGLWHTVLTRPDFYLETSGSALIGYSLGRSSREGWLSETEVAIAARSASLAIWRAASADGTLTEVSGPTGPMTVEEWYNAIPQAAPQLYGQGIALMIGSPISSSSFARAR